MNAVDEVYFTVLGPGGTSRTDLKTEYTVCFFFFPEEADGPHREERGEVLEERGGRCGRWDWGGGV